MNGGGTLRRALLAAVLANLCLGAMSAGAKPPAPAQPLWLMTVADWRKVDLKRRQVIAGDYMRVFCGSRVMPLPAFIRCLDRRAAGRRQGEMFPLASVCLTELS